MPPALRLEHLSKSFGSFRALDDISWQVEAGEIHALVGMNGSGKSTLVKALAGYHQPDAGSRLELWGREVPLPVRDTDQAGIGIIHQDLGLADDMTVVENVGLGSHYGTQGLRAIRWAREAREAADALSVFGLEVSPRTLIRDLGRGERTIVALARTLRRLKRHSSQSLLLLDEPTVAFDRGDVERLFRVMRQMADAGNAVVFISHRLSEVLEISDRISVIRDGQLAATVRPDETSTASMVELMLGRRLESFYPERPPAMTAPPVLELRDISGRRLRDVTLDLHGGEILGITGLVGMGQDELPEILAGTRRPRAGAMRLRGRPVERWTPGSVRALGMAIVPAERHREGLWLEADAVDNITLPVLRRYFRSGLLRHPAMRAAATQALGRYRVRPGDPDRLVRMFSGGNQQKIVMARALQDQPHVLILHQPTVGVDAAAKREILEIVCDAVRQGAGVLYVSTEYEELAHLCHRVLVFENGRIQYEISGQDVTEKEILARCHLG